MTATDTPTTTDIAAEPTCQMEADCPHPVTHLDQKGFIYCTRHGIERRSYRPCRKLRPHEVNRIRRGQQITRY